MALVTSIEEHISSFPYTLGIDHIQLDAKMIIECKGEATKSSYTLKATRTCDLAREQHKLGDTEAKKWKRRSRCAIQAIAKKLKDSGDGAKKASMCGGWGLYGYWNREAKQRY